MYCVCHILGRNGTEATETSTIIVESQIENCLLEATKVTEFIVAAMDMEHSHAVEILLAISKKQPL